MFSVNIIKKTFTEIMNKKIHVLNQSEICHHKKDIYEIMNKKSVC